MLVRTPSGQSAQAQIAPDYKQQIADYDRRQEITYRYSTLISVSNPKRLQFIESIDELMKSYENSLD